jgi:superfamily II DNA/RNA helicase
MMGVGTRGLVSSGFITQWVHHQLVHEVTSVLTRDELASRYLEQLPYAPYPVQEEALLAWFTAEQGVMVCAPTGMGKTLIAHAALFEALHTGKVAYYTTPLIALTEQKFNEMQAAALKWGFSPDDVGLVTGNRQVNPNAKVLIVVAEILLNRLLAPQQFDFSQVSAVVMDEFHSFADQERGIVWELSLALLPQPIRLLMLSATVGNSREFINWLERCHGRKVELVESRERKVPLSYHWVPDELLGEHLTDMAEGDTSRRKMPALVFCFNRDECWSVAEQLKGLPLVDGSVRSELLARCNRLEWKEGIGPKLKQMLGRGVGVHHAGLLPKYRRVVEELFTRKLLAVVVCTETLGAGINLPARSVVLTTLVKGPFGKQKLIEPSIAHQIFGRAGRPQYDIEGHVYALAHEDDVKLLRWKQKYDSIPENTKDTGLLKAKKDLKRKKPERRANQVYWNESQFNGLQQAPPGKLYSKGPLSWRWLGYVLKSSPEVSRLRTVVRKRLLDEPRIIAGEKVLVRMLLTLHRGGFVRLEPEPPASLIAATSTSSEPSPSPLAGEGRGVGERSPGRFTVTGQVSAPPHPNPPPPGGRGPEGMKDDKVFPSPPAPLPQGERGEHYQPDFAHPTELLDKLVTFRAIQPLYGVYLMDYLGAADRAERLQLMESLLELPRPLLRYVRVPWPDRLAPGPLAALIDPELVQRGLMAAPKHQSDDEEEDDFEDNRDFPLSLAEKMWLLFEAKYPEVADFEVQSVWSAGELLLDFKGNFTKYIASKDLAKQEGILFRHFLRLILLCGEFKLLTPAGITPEDWQKEMDEISDQLTASCRSVDPDSTDEVIQQIKPAAPAISEVIDHSKPAVPAGFGEGIF